MILSVQSARAQTFVRGAASEVCVRTVLFVRHCLKWSVEYMQKTLDELQDSLTRRSDRDPGRGRMTLSHFGRVSHALRAAAER